MDYQSNHNTNQIELRKIQAFVLVLPKDFVSVLNITKGDYVKSTIVEDSLVVKKADL
jgi:antitoxin component of MazEF toxin-antitoxin module